MNKKGIVVFCLLWLLSSCAHRPDDIYQRAIEYAQSLVDSGYITDEYIQLYELGTNDSGSIYSIFGTDSPNSDCTEYPSRIIKVGEKYFCFTELDEPELSVEQIYRITNVYDAGLGFRSNDIWFLGISKYKNSGAMVKRSPDVDYLFDYPELWPYSSGGQPENHDFYMWLFAHNILLTDVNYWDSDSLKFHIKKICGKIHMGNKTDSLVVLSPDIFNRTFIVVNGTDTLMLSLQDSLPVDIPANSSATLRFESKENKDFFQKLPHKNTWMSLYKLLSDSTFSLLKINGKVKTIRLLHDDSPYIYLRNDSGKILKEIWNEGIFNKEKRKERFWNTKQK